MTYPPKAGQSSGPSRPPSMLTRAEGWSTHARDLDWHAKSVPCQIACPAGTDIPGYLEEIAAGRFAEAYRINLRDNVLPAVLGRVCTRPCEPACRHGFPGNGEPVAICFAKRSADAFMASREPVVLPRLFPSTGKRIGIIGAGAAGLSAARELARMGHAVEILEKETSPGGLMMHGIPAFRLPREVVERETAQVLAQGITFRGGVEIGTHALLDEIRAQYDALVVAVGCEKTRLPGIPGQELAGVRHGLDFLREANRDLTTPVPSHVVVVGGGFTAVDCARMARRLGAEHVTMMYRRTAAEMYITPHELDAFRMEGIDWQFLVAPMACLGSEGHVERVQFTRCVMGPQGDDGRATSVPIQGEDFTLNAHLVLLATGQESESWTRSLPPESEGVFLAGDVATGPGSLIDAIGHAKTVVRRIDTFLMGASRLEDGVVIRNAGRTTTGRTAAMDTWPREIMPEVPPEERLPAAEVEKGLDEEAALREAQRCYLCHFKFEIDNDLCIYCDRCLKVMPVEDCIVKVSTLLTDKQDRVTGFKRATGVRDYNLLVIDPDACIRCGRCVEVCPVDCITLQKVTRETRPCASPCSSTRPTKSETARRNP